MNNIINKIKYLSVFLISLSMMFACTSNFEEWNQEEGRPTVPQAMEGNYLLWAYIKQMQNYVYPAQENAYQMGQNLISDPYGRYLSISNTNWTNSYSTFNAPNGWLESPFKDTNSNIVNPWVLISELTGKEGHVFALSQILRIASMQRLTDMQGPVAYSVAGTGALVVTYDSQEDAYKQMINDLDAAVKVLSEFDTEDYMMTKQDQVYSGDLSKWIRYANSLKLRMAMRIVYADEATAHKWAKEAIEHPGGVLDSNADNPSCPFPQHPVWTVVTSWGDSRACADIIAYMNGYEDPRISKYFTPNTAKNVVVEGKDIYLGVRTGVDLNKYTTARLKDYSATTYERGARTAWMYASEIAFLKAEAAMRGWSEFGGVAAAKGHYEEGIRLSFDQWGAAGADEYIANTTLKPAGIVDPTEGMSANPVSTITIAWNDNDDFETKLERLITQKWIAMYPFGLEAWSDQRRTGYPRFFPVLVNGNEDKTLSTRFASRIPFSPKEREGNKTNYDEAVKLLGGSDTYGTRLWWDKKPNKPNW